MLKYVSNMTNLRIRSPDVFLRFLCEIYRNMAKCVKYVKYVLNSRDSPRKHEKVLQATRILSTRVWPELIDYVYFVSFRRKAVT